MRKTGTTALFSTLASVRLWDAWTDFYLSRQAMSCAPSTLEFYRHTAGAFLQWIEGQAVTDPADVTARHVRAYLAGLTGRDTTLHTHARAIKTLLRFWHNEGYMFSPVCFDMPKLSKKRLPVLTAEELGQIVKACNVRDKAIVLFMADSGLRRGEVVRLNWSDVDIQTGLVRVKQGRAFTSASVVILEARHAVGFPPILRVPDAFQIATGTPQDERKQTGDTNAGTRPRLAQRARVRFAAGDIVYSSRLVVDPKRQGNCSLFGLALCRFIPYNNL